jgi:hypothetical protein
MSIFDSITYSNKTRVAVCLPARDQMHTATSFCLYNLAQDLTHNRIEHTLFVSPGTLIANQRHELVKSSIEWGATHVLFIDSDITFQPEHVLSLIEHKLPIVGAAYSKRVEPIIPTAWYNIDDWDSWIKVEEHSEDLIEVAAMGLGFCLIETSVFEKLSLPWFQLGFKQGQYTGEDIEFFRKVSENDIPIYLDINVTKELGHLGTFEFKVCRDS